MYKRQPQGRAADLAGSAGGRAAESSLFKKHSIPPATKADGTKLPGWLKVHGTAANGAIFKMQLSPFLPKLAEIADVRFVDGPKDIDPENPQAAMMRQFFGAKQRLREFAEATVDDRGWRTYEGLEAGLAGSSRRARSSAGARRSRRRSASSTASSSSTCS